MKCLRLPDAWEVELENYVGRIVMGLMDAVCRDARFFSSPREAVECCLPRREIGDCVLNVQRCH